MKLVDLLTESKSADLYHGTTAPNAERILTTNTLKANAPVYPNMKQYIRGPGRYKNGAYQTVSFSRSMSAARSFAEGAPRRTGIEGVVFVIDQQRLWQTVGRRMTSYSDLHGGDPATTKKSSTEYEETVLGDITNFGKFIKHIYVYVSPQYKDMVNAQQFPSLLSHPKTQLVINKNVKNTNRQYDRFDTAREFDRNTQRLSSNNVEATE